LPSSWLSAASPLVFLGRAGGGLLLEGAGVLSVAAALLSWFEELQRRRLVAGERRGVMSMLGDEHRILSQHREPVVHPFGVGGVLPVWKEPGGVGEGRVAECGVGGRAAGCEFGHRGA
jgi:hypothetical protein